MSLPSIRINETEFFGSTKKTKGRSVDLWYFTADDGDGVDIERFRVEKNDSEPFRVTVWKDAAGWVFVAGYYEDEVTDAEHAAITTYMILKGRAVA